MDITEEIKAYIEEYIRPRVQSDGGEIRFLSFNENVLTVKLQGECSRCPISGGCFSEWLTKEINKKFGSEIKLKRVVEKPYFWNS
jgi:Fe-S cluster biogenesis protein NfuA